MILSVGLTALAVKPIVGAARTELIHPLLKDKRIGILTNHTGKVGDTRTIDKLMSLNLPLKRIFTPEHGLAGSADAGAKVNSTVDASTGVPVTSLYGTRLSNAALDDMVSNLDVIVVDLQDVGTRFYTYYITMMRLMNSAARTGKEFVVLDRPNPNGMMVDGPTLDMAFKSGVGALPIPVAHGMTMGELAQMIVGEEWLDEKRALNLTVVPCLNYTHSTRYPLPVPPSPNLRSELAVALYPSLCFFEGTPVSVGRGTDNPFTLFGHPDLKGMDYDFTPRSVVGATNPPCRNQLCHGRNLSTLPIDSVLARGVDLSWVIEAYKAYPAAKRTEFFTKFFNLLAGNSTLASQIAKGWSAERIRRSWQPDLEAFHRLREPYLLYEE